MNRKFTLFLASFFATILFSIGILPNPSLAQTPAGNQGANNQSQTTDEVPDTDCPNPDYPHDAPLTKDNCKIILYLVNGINFLTAAAGMVIIFSIMISGYQYMTARDNQQWVVQARQRIVWALVALLMMIFTYTFLNWIVPGGVLPDSSPPPAQPITSQDGPS